MQKGLPAANRINEKAMKELPPGKRISVQAADKGSFAVIKVRAKKNDLQYLGTVEDGHVLKYYLRKAIVPEEK